MGVDEQVIRDYVLAVSMQAHECANLPSEMMQEGLRKQYDELKSLSTRENIDISAVPTTTFRTLSDGEVSSSEEPESSSWLEKFTQRCQTEAAEKPPVLWAYWGL